MFHEGFVKGVFRHMSHAQICVCFVKPLPTLLPSPKIYQIISLTSWEQLDGFRDGSCTKHTSIHKDSKTHSQSFQAKQGHMQHYTCYTGYTGWRSLCNVAGFPIIMGAHAVRAYQVWPKSLCLCLCLFQWLRMLWEHIRSDPRGNVKSDGDRVRGRRWRVLSGKQGGRLSL